MNEDDPEASDSEYTESLALQGIIPSNRLLTVSAQTLALLLVMHVEGGMSELVTALTLAMNDGVLLKDFFEQALRFCIAVVVAQAVATIVLAIALVRLQAPWLRRDNRELDSPSMILLLLRGVGWSLGMFVGYLWWRSGLRCMGDILWGDPISLARINKAANSSWAFMCAGCTILVVVLYPFTRVVYRKRWWR